MWRAQCSSLASACVTWGAVDLPSRPPGNRLSLPQAIPWRRPVGQLSGVCQAYAGRLSGSCQGTCNEMSRMCIHPWRACAGVTQKPLQCLSCTSSKSEPPGTHTHLASLPWICVRPRPRKRGPTRPMGQSGSILDQEKQRQGWLARGFHRSRGAGAPTSAT